MGKYSSYRYLMLRDNLGPARNGTRTDSKSRPRRKLQRIFITTVIITSVLFIGLYTSALSSLVEHIAQRLGYHERVYAVIIDAGSTGSRVLAYTFHKSYIGGHLVLDDELFKEVLPGLSSYANNPNEAAASISVLLEAARSVVPAEARATSPLLLRATAGLRLLPASAAQEILASVSRTLADSGFHVGPHAVEIMDGADEGINSWFTVNFLQGRLAGGETTAALDLGGGSTQVTYVPPADGPTPLLSLPGPHGNVSLHTQSYLNLGLMAVRRGVLLAENSAESTHPSSSCVNSIIKDKKWRYLNVDYHISGSQEGVEYIDVKETMTSVSARIPVVSRKRCSHLISSVLKKLLPATRANLQGHPVTAFSYYFDRCAEAGLIDPVQGGKVEVHEVEEAAQRECDTPNTEQPWACLDLSYISLLLRDGFQLKEHKTVELVKKISGHEISWALGLAYNTLVGSL